MEKYKNRIAINKNRFLILALVISTSIGFTNYFEKIFINLNIFLYFILMTYPFDLIFLNDFFYHEKISFVHKNLKKLIETEQFTCSRKNY